MMADPKFVGFGAPAEFGAHVFRVEIPISRSESESIRIIEDFGFKGGEGGLPYEELRVILPRDKWTLISETARADFNERLKSRKIPSARWQTGKNLLDRLLGKELCVLAWASERARLDEIPVIANQWGALRPEERWWLFSMTAIQGGRADDKERGWRKALYHALSDGDNISPPQKQRRAVVKSGLPFSRFMGGNE